MLSTAERTKFQAAQEQVLDLLGVPAVFKQTKAPHLVKNLTIGFKTVSWKDEELINAFGVGAKVLTLKFSDLAAIEKFDRFTVGGEDYTADAVMPVHLNGVQIFWKVYIRGK